VTDSKQIVLYCARHGSTVLNGGNCFRGHLDVSLDKQGFRDAHELAHLFEPIDLSFIVSSDRKRAKQTADVIVQPRACSVHTTPNLRAWNVGDLSGQPKTPENEELVEYHVQHPDEPLPRGESLNQFKARVRPAIIEAIEISNRAGEPGLLVVHSSIIHEVGAMLHGDHEAELVEPGGVIAIYTDRGDLKSEAIFKPKTAVPKKADTVS
jgi:broad specificity phosphatase PhoE